MKTIQIETRKINDWGTFHDVFAQAFGFPDFYGRNMDAWIDCMSDISTTSQQGMTAVRIGLNEKLILDIPEADAWKKRCPEVFEAFIDCVAFANYRNLEAGEEASLLLFLH